MRFSITSCCAFMVLSISCLYAQEIQVVPNTPASPATGSWYPWYEIHADPEDPNILIVCGSRWDAKDDAQYGFVYSSSDAGKNWRLALEDKHSTWVSEESCAFGAHGVAYYIADASKVDETGMLHHDLGATYIYSSRDSGRTWKTPIKTGWTDYSTSVVDPVPGPNQNRLYVFFNDLSSYYHSLNDQKALDGLPKGGNTVGLIGYRYDDVKVSDPVFNPDMAATNYRGSYPAPSFLLKDGSLLTLFFSHLNPDPADREKHEYLIASIRSNPDRTTLEKPVTVASDTPSSGEKEKCGFGLTSAAAYDELKNIVYFAYPLGDEKSCHLMLTSSADGGRTWKPAERIRLPNENSDAIYVSPALSVNKDGVLGLMWQEGNTDCWNFAASTGSDNYFRVSKKLNACYAESENQPIADTYLWSVPFQANPKITDPQGRVDIRYMKNAVWRDSDAIAVTPDGVFHPVWIDAGDGRGEIRTAAVTVTSAEQLASAEVSGLTPVSTKVAILYGGAQHYDTKNHTLTLALILRNTSDTAIKAPFKLEATYVNPKLEVTNATNHATAGGAVWDITNSIPGGVLAPGATSKPYTLIFHTDATNDLSSSFNTKVYATPSM